MLRAEGNDELLVSLVLAVLVENAEESLATVEGLASLTETTGKTVVDERNLQDTLEGLKDGHLAALGIGRNLDLRLGRESFYVRLYIQSKAEKVSILVSVIDRQKANKKKTEKWMRTILK